MMHRETFYVMGACLLLHAAVVAQDSTLSYDPNDEAHCQIYSSPNGTIHVVQHYRGSVEFLNAGSGRKVYEYNPTARDIELIWTGDSQWVAIREGCSRFRAYLSVFRIHEGRVTPVRLPPAMALDPIHLLPMGFRPPVIEHDEGYGFKLGQWRRGNKLLVYESGGGATYPHGGFREYYWNFEFLVQCEVDGSSRILRKRLLDFDISDGN